MIPPPLHTALFSVLGLVVVALFLFAARPVVVVTPGYMAPDHCCGCPSRPE